jgi:hypothetical protein
VTTEAQQLFAEQVARWRAESWANLRGHLKDPVAYEIRGASGLVYQFEAEVLWDDRRNRNLRVFVTGDDGRGWRWWGMRSEDFIKAPDGSFVGE